MNQQQKINNNNHEGSMMPKREPLQIENMHHYALTKAMACAQGIDVQHIEKTETLYYDESGNIKHLKIKNGKLNSDYREVFVLGGVQAEDSISKDELLASLGCEDDKELKANKLLRGDFLQILRKQHLSQVLQLVEQKGWHIHFCVVQVLYYAFVDIVDSIEKLRHNPMAYKAALYNVLKSDIELTVNHFKKYKYPNIDTNKIPEFLDGIIKMVNEYIEKEDNLDIIILLTYLGNALKDAKQLKELVFIQDEVPDEWVSEFTQFYQQEIYKFPMKTLIFDEEKVVHRDICELTTMYMNGKPMDNFRFDESEDNPMIQVSDSIVGILRKYIQFLDREDEDIEADIANMSDIQMDNFRLMNRLLNKSLNYNPMFFHFIASQFVVIKFHRYREIYG